MINFFEMLQKAQHSLFLNRTRTLLSCLGVLFGVAAIVAMLSIGEGAKRETIEQIQQLGVHTIVIKQSELSLEQHQKARQQLSRGLTIEDVELLSTHLPALSNVAPVRVVESHISAAQQEVSPEILALTASYQRVMNIKMFDGRFITDQDYNQHALVCVLGFDIARALGQSGGVGRQVRIGDLQFLVVGILAQRQQIHTKQPIPLNARNLNRAILIPLGAESSLPNRNPNKSHLLSEILLQLEPSGDVVPASQIAKRIMEVSHRGVDDYQIIVPEELVNQALRTQQTYNFVLGSIAAISLLVGGIGIMNIMLANVFERKREIGIRRAVGATKEHIVMQFLAEALLLAITGAAGGIVLGLVMTGIISTVAGWPVAVTTWSVLLAVAMAASVGVAAGLYPAIRAAELDPIAALRASD